MDTRFSLDGLFQINIYHLHMFRWQYCGLPSFFSALVGYKMTEKERKKKKKNKHEK